MERRHATIATVAITVTLCWAGSASAQWSRMRLIDVKPARSGATATLQVFDNDWGSPEKNDKNAKIEVYAYNFDPTGKPSMKYTGNEKGWICAAEGAQHLGTFSCVGNGEIKLPIDYGKLGFKAEQPLYISGLWCESGHLWGEWQSGRPTGSLPLPKATAARATKKTASKNARWTCAGAGAWPRRPVRFTPRRLAPRAPWSRALRR